MFYEKKHFSHKNQKAEKRGRKFDEFFPRDEREEISFSDLFSIPEKKTSTK